MTNTPQVILKPRRAQPFFGHHPWVFSGAIDQIEGQPADGDEVQLQSHQGEFIAHGLFNSQSNIRVRLYSWDEDTALDESFFRQRLQQAIALRSSFPEFNGAQSACRLVFSESDGLSGLTVDRYDRWLVVQITSLALAERLDLLLDLLEEFVQPEGILLRTEKGIRDLEGLELQDGLLRGTIPAEPIIIEEANLKFRVHLQQGQKTGFYLDQRDNRRRVSELAHGRRVLDGFCYSGGFGLHAAKAGASSVIGLDVSQSALTLARENVALNELTNFDFIQGDVFKELQNLVDAEAQFDIVVLDPPKFARRRSAVDDGLRGYRQLHALALKLLSSDGYLVTCCCSGLITADLLLSQLADLAVEEHCSIQLIEQRGPSRDHPVSVHCLESSYLECLICRVTK